jgi:hypothetical protein
VPGQQQERRIHQHLVPREHALLLPLGQDGNKIITRLLDALVH